VTLQKNKYGFRENKYRIYENKFGFVVRLFEEGKSRNEIKEILGRKYPGMSKNYISVLVSRAAKRICDAQKNLKK
jgi:hypothetical protein